MKGKILGFYQYLRNIGISPLDSKEESFRKSTFTLIAFLKCIGCIVWSGMFAALGMPTAAMFPLTFGIIICFSILLFIKTKKYSYFVNIALLFMLLIPTFLQWSLGGFASSGMVMIWSFLSPLGALVFLGSRAAKIWFAGFTAMLLISVALENFLLTIQSRPFWMIAMFLIMNIGVVSTIVFATVAYFVNQTKREHKKAEDLLLNILPNSIIVRMKNGEKMIADEVDSVTVLFADIVGFTQLSAKLSAHKLIDLLNMVFSEFDRLAEYYGLEKIKTIGDAYMVAGGLINQSHTNHCYRIVQMAMDMQTIVSRSDVTHLRTLDIRIGIHTGSVIAGVIGIKKFNYDVWGDTVNTASRMESHGEAGKIHVTESVYHQLKNQFIFQERGLIDVKGKGEMSTYFLIDKQ